MIAIKLFIIISLCNYGLAREQPELQLISVSRSVHLVKYTEYSDAVVMHFNIPDHTLFASFVFESLEQDLSIFGLTQYCQAYVDAAVYVNKVDNPTIVTADQLVNVIGESNESRYFIFMVPEQFDYAILNIENMNFSSNFKEVTLRVAARRPPSQDAFILHKTITNSSQPCQAVFRTEHQSLYYIVFDFKINFIADEASELNFRLQYFTGRIPSSKSFISQNVGNITLFNMSVVHKYHQSHKLTEVQSYQQFNLAREAMGESFVFSYKLEPEMDNGMFVPINITTNEFTVLKFAMLKGSDIGGTLQYTLAFKPRVLMENNVISLIDEPEDHIIVGCIHRNGIAVPTWPKHCVSNEMSMNSPLILNETISNSTVLIPYPESGVWYATFKLFCGKCEPCDCPESCQEEYERCTIECELNCISALAEDCQICVENCTSSILSTEGCSSCNCDGPCLRNSSSTCNSSVVFDVSSRPCYFGNCGKQGTCGLLISEGVAYSSCICSNNYRGFDCSDGSLATPYYLVLLEFLLLVLSNIFFLPATYIALKREYYVEALSYFSIFLSSSFYHACDAGENILSFCIVRLGALQFSDFFSALLAIWLTLLAMADLPPVYLSILQMAGSIIIAFCVTLNRYAFWIFALPACVGLVIIGISWYLKYRKYKSRFIDRRYLYFRLPIGGAVVVVGLIIYGLLQTQDNYKYLHSLWHMIMATGVFFLLPKRDTFQAAVLLS